MINVFLAAVESAVDVDADVVFKDPALYRWLFIQVHYATALDWFIICSFGYCMASLLEFAGVHYFTKVSL